MSRIIGIDLGTTNSAVAVMEGDTPKVILNEEGSRTTPSVVAFTTDGERVVGASAKRQAITNPENTIYSAKRFMGMQFKDSRDEAQQMPYAVKRTKDGSCRIHVSGEKYAPQQLSAIILQKLKRSAESYLGTEVTEAVITVPAYFNDAQRQATKEAGKIAGLEVKRIINEPTAAALAYGLNSKSDQRIAVYDLGGGTFDISILEVTPELVEVLSTNGDTHLGGDDVDTILITWLINEFKKDTGLDVSSDTMVIQRLKEAAEKAKIELSSVKKTEINLPFLTADTSGPKHLTTSLTRTKFNRMIKEFVDKTITPVKNALKDAKLKTSDIDEIILVGGSTRIPAVREAVEKFFGKTSNNSVNPDEVVALGAAVQAGVFSGDVDNLLLLDVTPLSLGIETLGGVMSCLIPRNTTVPCKKSEVFSTAVDGQPAVDINVLQGERQFAKDNNQLGNFKLEGIPPQRRGIPQIEVTFDIDANGIVSVSAKDTKTNKEQAITIENSNSLSEEEINQMMEDAKLYEAEDAEKKDKLEKYQKLENGVYEASALLHNSQENLEESVKENLENEINNAKNILESEDYEEMDDAFAVLSKLTADIAVTQFQKENPTMAPDVEASTPNEDTQ